MSCSNVCNVCLSQGQQVKIELTNPSSVKPPAVPQCLSPNGLLPMGNRDLPPISKALSVGAISTPPNIMLQKSRKKKHQRNIKINENINPRCDVQQTITKHHLWGTFIAKRRTWDGFSIEVEILTCYWWLGPQLVLTTTNDNQLNQQIFAKLQIYLATARIEVRIICNIEELRCMSPWEPQRTGTLSCINKWVAAAMTSEEIAWIFQWHEISRKARWYLLSSLKPT